MDDDRIGMCLDVLPPTRLAQPVMLIVKGKTYPPGTELRVRFLDGSKEQHRQVMTWAKELEEHANIRLRWVTRGEAHIRITLKPGPAWSLIGSDGLLETDDRKPTMQLGWLAREVVLHEFLHALGGGHEHKSPAAPQDVWNLPYIVQVYADDPNRWPPAYTFEQVIKRYAQSEVSNTRYDQTSILHYPRTRKMVTRDEYVVGMNKDLSPLDRQLLGEWYPR